MALREGECCLVRRVADRGIGKNIGCSRAREDRFNHDRRFADRGNEIGNRDPRDIIKIKRLRQRVRDLEEIRRLRQRVRDLELQRERRVTETESGNIVRDVVNEEEEYPFDRHPPRFYEPIYQHSFSEDEPVFDENGMEPDEEECLLVQKLLSGITIFKDEPNIETDGNDHGNNHKFVEVSSGMFDFFNRKPVVYGGEKVAKGGDVVAMEIALIEPINMRELKYYWLNKEFTNQSKIQIEVISEFPNFVDILIDNSKNKFLFPNIGALQRDLDDKNRLGPNVTEDCMGLNFGCMVFLDKNSPRGPSIKKNGVVDLIELLEALEYWTSTNTHGVVDCGGPTKNPYKANNITAIFSNGPNATVEAQVSNINRDTIRLINVGKSVRPFDPGGIGLESGESTCEVKSFRWFIITADRNRVDVPFDPGDFGPNAKLEDEFFSKRGRMMQGYLQVGI